MDADVTTAARDDLVARLLAHCRTMCVTGEEGPIADEVEARYRDAGEAVTRIGHSVVVDGRRTDRAAPLVLLVGHLDVVAPTEVDRDPRVEDRDGEEVIAARGTSDMKAGNVVAMRAFEDLQLRATSPYDLALVLYSGEEGDQSSNELRSVLAATPWLTEADLAIVLEPTDGGVHLGCLGSLQAEVTFTGQQAHSARPWHGENALTKAGAFLAELHEDHLADVDVDGIAYRDAWSATLAWTSGLEPGPARAGTVFRNVIPGSFTVNLNLRFAPSRGLEEAEAELRARVGDRAEVAIIDRSPAAPPHPDAPVVAAFVAAVDAPVAAKQAWTDVARFTEAGVPALNYGPGLTAQAHQRGEYVPVQALVDADVQLRRFLAGQAVPDEHA